MSRVLVLGGFAPTLMYFRAPLLKAMVETGHDVHAAVPPEDPRVEPAMTAMGVQFHPITFERNRVQPLGDMMYVRRVRRLIRAISPDRVLCYTIKPAIYGGWAARAEGVDSAAMVTGLGSSLMNPGPLRRAVVCMFRRACRHHDVVFVQNTEDREDLVTLGILPDVHKTVLTAGSGIDLDRFPQRPIPEAPSFLMLARLLVAKGVREYIEAARLLRADGLDVPIRLAGMEETCSRGVPLAEVKAAHDQGIIEYLGNLDDVRDALAACTAFVLPSWYEGTPHSVLEAMSTGRAVVTTDTRGCRDTVEDGATGHIVPVRDPERLAAAMARLARDHQACAAMGRAARIRAESMYDARDVADVMMRALGL